MLIMEKKNVFTRSLAIIGTILAWLPVAAPFIFGFISLASDGIFRFDYLMPAEFAFLAFAGGILLLWAAVRTRSRAGIIAWGLGIAVIAMAVLMLVGDVVLSNIGWQWECCCSMRWQSSCWASAASCCGATCSTRRPVLPHRGDPKGLVLLIYLEIVSKIRRVLYST